ncbi:MAG: hypothetical protein K6B39_00035 [Lachnospiraceae bacterium]|nr:hypothetical protein [Lachnospiraceae bacterium]
MNLAWYGINDRTAYDLVTAMQPETARRNMTETAALAVREISGRSGGRSRT